MKVDHISYDCDGRSFHFSLFCQVSDVFKGSYCYSLVWPGSLLYDRNRSFWILTVFHEFFSISPEHLYAHKYHKSSPKFCQSLPIKSALLLCGVLVSCYESDHRGAFPVGYWNSRISRHCNCRSDPWHDFKLNAFAYEYLSLFTPSSEDIGIA